MLIVDSLVVGGGVSGSFIANRLATFFPEDEILVIERSDRLGGRLLSRPLKDSVIDAEYGGMRYFSNVTLYTAKAVKVLGLTPVIVPNVVPSNLYYLRRKRMKFDQLAEKAQDVYNLPPSEKGKGPGELFSKMVDDILNEYDIKLNQVYDVPAITKQSIWTAYSSYYSSEMINLTEDSSGYDLIKKNYNLAQIMRVEDLLFSSTDPQLFVENGYNQIATGFLKQAKFKIFPPRVDVNPKESYNRKIFLNVELLTLKIKKDGTILALLQPVRDKDIQDEILTDSRKVGSPFLVKCRRLFLTTMAQALKNLSCRTSLKRALPINTERILDKLSPISYIKIFLKFEKSWWEELGFTQGGKNITDLPMRQVWFYTPNIIMIYSPGNAARYWLPFLPFRFGHPEFLPPDQASKLAKEALKQLSEMFVYPAKDMELKAISWRFWNEGSLRWRPGNINKNYNSLMRPYGKEVSVYMANAAYSKWQGWVEGALEMSDDMLSRELGLPRFLPVPSSTVDV